MKLESSIHSWGVAVPRRRLSNQTCAKAWGQARPPGDRAVAGADEDAITLGAEAALQALDRTDSVPLDKAKIDALIFASTTAPFSERSCAAMLADVLGLRSDILCLDLNSSLRSGTSALAVAARLVASQNGEGTGYALVVAADTRSAEPGSADECLIGHAGVSVLLGPAHGAVATICGFSCQTSSLADSFRRGQDRFSHSADARFCRVVGYAPAMQKVVESILEETGWTPDKLSRVVPYSPDTKSAAQLLKKNGFNVGAQYCDPVSSRVGLTGCAHTLIMLVAALEKSSKGDRLLALGYGDGADGLALEVTDDTAGSLFEQSISSGYEVSYNQYLSMSGLLAKEHKCSTPFASEIMSERNKELWCGLKGRRCTGCSTIITLPLPACPRCGVNSEFETIDLARRGVVFAITHEEYFPTPEPPLGMAIVDLNGGGRMTLQVADEDEPLRIGDKVELVWRRLIEAGGLPGYFWKCRKAALRPEEGGA